MSRRLAWTYDVADSGWASAPRPKLPSPRAPSSLFGEWVARAWAARSRLRDGKRQEPAAVHGGCATDGLDGFVWLSRLLQFRYAGEVEEELLGVAAVETEVGGGKFLDARSGEKGGNGEH